MARTSRKAAVNTQGPAARARRVLLLVATHIRDVSPEEMRQAMQKMGG